MSLHEDRIEKTLGSVTGDYEGQIPDPQSRIEVLLQKILENGGGSGSGIQSAILDDSQYDIHGIPIVENPVEGLLYLVPNGESGDDTYNEFLYVDGAWEKIGTTYENGYTKSELDFKLPFGVESITVGDTILDNVTLSMHKDGDEDWYISDNISGLTTTNFKMDHYYILEIDGVSKLCRAEYLPSGYPDFVSWHDCTVVGDLGLIGKRCATPEEIAALPEGTVAHGGYYATFDNRFPEFKFDDYCIARRFKNDNNFNLYTSDTSATHTVTLKAATVVFTQVPSYLSGMNGVAHYTNVSGMANTSLGNAGLQPSNTDTVYAEGVRNYVSEQASHAEGVLNVVSGFYSHAEGHGNVVSGNLSHAEGCFNVAGGFQNHVEGRNNVTSNRATHASGMLNIASGNASFVIGQACVEDTESTDRTMDLNSGWVAGYKKHVFIVGNGVGDHANGHEQASTRSNAHTLDWHGNAEYAGDVKANACGGENPVSLVEVNDNVTELKSALTQMQEEIDSFEGISDDVKVALLDCFAHVAWIDEHGQDYYDALEVALYNLVSISAVYTQSGIVRTSDSLDSLKNNLVVTALNVDGTQKIIPGTKYELSGVLIVGTSTITVSYKNKTTTFTVNVSDERLQYELASGTDIAGQRIDTYTPVPAYNEDFTFIAKVTLRKNTSGATAAMLARRGGLNDDSQAVFRIGVDYSDGYIHFITNYLYSDYYAEYYTPGNISQSSDHELVWVVRNNNKILKKILYVDNNRILNKSENTNSYARSRGGNIEIGLGATFDGVVSMFRIYNAALTDDEIEAMLNMDIF